MEQGMSATVTDRVQRRRAKVQEHVAEIERKHPLATKRGLNLMVALLFHTGAMCPKCSYGTRRTSKRWAKCKKCGERVERRELPK
jgi:hypothetical protein